jgi:glutamate synthase domain-containing protein 2
MDGFWSSVLINARNIQEVVFLAVLVFLLVSFIALFIYDVRQKQHAILRNYPIIGHMRSVLERLGVYLRAFLYSRDREELPFNRVARTWVYKAAKNVDTTVGFGSTRDLRPIGKIYFVDAPFPVLDQDSVPTRPMTIGPFCPAPYTTCSLINISAMSFGAISVAAIQALTEGAKMAGCWVNTGEGGLTQYHLAAGCDLIAQIGTAKYGYRDEDGQLSVTRLQQTAAHPNVKMFEIKLSQGAKPGKGGVLLAVKVTEEVAAIRGIMPHRDSISPNRFPEIANSCELLDFIQRVRDITGKPTGIKTVLGNYEWLDDFFGEIHRRGIEHAPDFITLDGAEGGTGAAPMSLTDYMGLPITESLPVLVDTLVAYGLRDRIKVIASGKLITPSKVVWALGVGADFVNSARGFMFALGCIQALRCHNNTCPTGIATQNPRLQKGLDPVSKAIHVRNYVNNINYEVGVIAHSCGVPEPRELQRHHIRIVAEHGTSVAFDEIYPNKQPGEKWLTP